MVLSPLDPTPPPVTSFEHIAMGCPQWHTVLCSSFHSQCIAKILHYWRRIGSVLSAVVLYDFHSIRWWFCAPGQFLQQSDSGVTTGTATVNVQFGTQSINVLRIGCAATKATVTVADTVCLHRDSMSPHQLIPHLRTGCCTSCLAGD